MVNVQLVTLFLEWSLLLKSFCAFFAFLFCFMPVCVIVNSSFSFTLTVYLYTTHILFWSDPWRVAFSTSHREPLTRLSLPSFLMLSDAFWPFLMLLLCHFFCNKAIKEQVMWQVPQIHFVPSRLGIHSCKIKPIYDSSNTFLNWFFSFTKGNIHT